MMNKDAPIMMIALGPNRIAIPCRLFRDLASARSFCDGQTYLTRSTDPEDLPYWWTDDNKGTDGDLYITDPDLDLSTDEGHETFERIFLYYYGGCGSPWGFYLRPVDFDAPFVGFDLD
jgi:hypothetical protein